MPKFRRYILTGVWGPLGFEVRTQEWKDSSSRPAAHSDREAVCGAETATRSQGHAANKGARK